MEKYIHSSSETKTHLNKKEFRGPRKTRGTVSLYEEAEQRHKKPRAQCIHFMEVKHTDHEDCVISCIPNMWHFISSSRWPGAVKLLRGRRKAFARPASRVLRPQEPRKPLRGLLSV